MDKDIFVLGVEPEAIWLSILTAIVHIILELINLYIEARTWETQLLDYVVASYNAKQGWIPQQAEFTTYDGQKKQQAKKDPETFNFDQKDGEFCGQGFQVNF